MFSINISRNAKDLLRFTHIYSYCINVRFGSMMFWKRAYATVFFPSVVTESITKNEADQINSYYDVINISKKIPLKIKQ